MGRMWFDVSWWGFEEHRMESDVIIGINGKRTITYVDRNNKNNKHFFIENMDAQGGWDLINSEDMVCTCGVGVCDNCRKYRGNHA